MPTPNDYKFIVKRAQSKVIAEIVNLQKELEENERRLAELAGKNRRFSMEDAGYQSGDRIEILDEAELLELTIHLKRFTLSTLRKVERELC